jgi:acetyl esterase/lipase
MSPWSDITATGDSYLTLTGADPTLDVEILSWSADAYADPKDQKAPYVSPVYGDYAKAFPPTLIQGGTREIFLSNVVRLYQAIRSGGHEAVLDLYEGMPHVFQALTPNSPETRTAIARAAEFFKLHLKSG